MDKTEKLAEVSHEIWSHWMRYQFSQCQQQPDGSMVIPPDKVERWTRQMDTTYVDLTEQEKISDIHQSEKILKALGKAEEATIGARDWGYIRDVVQSHHERIQKAANHAKFGGAAERRHLRELETATIALKAVEKATALTEKRAGRFIVRFEPVEVQE